MPRPYKDICLPNLPDHLLHAFADGQLLPADAAIVAAALQNDAAARADVETIRQIGDVIRDAPLPLPSMDAHNRWLTAWQIARDRGVRRVAGWMTAAAAIVLGITVLTAARSEATQPTALAEWETAAVGSADDDLSPRTARLIAVDLALPSPEAAR